MLLKLRFAEPMAANVLEILISEKFPKRLNVPVPPDKLAILKVVKAVGFIVKFPLTDDERQFLTFIFTHISCTFEMGLRSSLIRIENLEDDVASLFESQRIVSFWHDTKKYHNRKFVTFIDRCASSVSKTNPGNPSTKMLYQNDRTDTRSIGDEPSVQVDVMVNRQADF